MMSFCHRARKKNRLKGGGQRIYKNFQASLIKMIFKRTLNHKAVSRNMRLRDCLTASLQYSKKLKITKYNKSKTILTFHMMNRPRRYKRILTRWLKNSRRKNKFLRTRWTTLSSRKLIHLIRSKRLNIKLSVKRSSYLRANLWLSLIIKTKENHEM